MRQCRFATARLRSLGVPLFVAGASLLLPRVALAQTVSTLAGSGAPGSVDGIGKSATFYNPTSVAVNQAGTLYVADQTSNKIRKISPGGTVTTVAGSGKAGSLDGTGVAASFSSPCGVAIDKIGNLYVADLGNNLIRKVAPSGLVSTLAGSRTPGSSDGKGTTASFNAPLGLAVDGAGNVYVADSENNKIRKIDASGNVRTLAGSGGKGHVAGNGAIAKFDSPSGVAVDEAGNVYVADSGNNMIRLIAPRGVVTTFAGTGEFSAKDGPAAEASFSNPIGVAVDDEGNVYVADRASRKIRLITPDRLVKTLAGSGQSGRGDGNAPSASFAMPTGVTVDAADNVYVADQANNQIRKITPPR
jgi:serine/threonine protein kinase, bacterial